MKIRVYRARPPAHILEAYPGETIRTWRVYVDGQWHAWLDIVETSRGMALHDYGARVSRWYTGEEPGTVARSLVPRHIRSSREV